MGWTRTRKLEARRRNLWRRLHAKCPLFATRLFAERLRQKPDYYGSHGVGWHWEKVATWPDEKRTPHWVRTRIASEEKTWARYRQMMADIRAKGLRLWDWVGAQDDVVHMGGGEFTHLPTLHQVRGEKPAPLFE